MFYDLKQAIQVCLLLEQDKVAKDGDPMEEYTKISRTNIFNNIDDHTRAHYQRMFKYVMEHAPYLGSLISKKKKCEELTNLIEDTSCLKSCMGSYTAPVSDKALD
ncbi:uncharacterized protein HD556DRAFT_1443433 [Suillus plorans]|uniref:Uncharacterized protein n=1 Tax=Suillus plorans TaxID=116603 RepID=A0A9P7AP92_9AGAM|nr:uncharacterized protein HD556DRAFT_1443433 [Suillus plorans]KAG1793642.1 hypothetical protein HD556DRAFT_1443433 [Suillus plorans]